MTFWLSEEQTPLFILHRIHQCVMSVSVYAPVSDLICFDPSSFPPLLPSHTRFFLFFFFFYHAACVEGLLQTSLTMRANSLSRRSVLSVSMRVHAWFWVFVSDESNSRLKRERISIFAVHFYTIAACSAIFENRKWQTEKEGTHRERGAVSGKRISHSALMSRPKIYLDKCTWNSGYCFSFLRRGGLLTSCGQNGGPAVESLYKVSETCG